MKKQKQKQTVRILIGIAVNLYNSLGSIYIVTLMSLLTHKQTVFLYLFKISLISPSNNL